MGRRKPGVAKEYQLRYFFAHKLRITTMKNTTTLLSLMAVALLAMSSCSGGGTTSTTVTPAISGHVLRGSAGDSVILDDTSYKLTYGSVTYSYTSLPYGTNGQSLAIKYSSSSTLHALLVYGSPILTFQPDLPSSIFKSSAYTGK
jgi:hypothetical protein